MRVIIVNDRAFFVLLTITPMKTCIKVSVIPPLLTSSSGVSLGMMASRGVTSQVTISAVHNHVALIFYSHS